MDSILGAITDQTATFGNVDRRTTLPPFGHSSYQINPERRITPRSTSAIEMGLARRR